MLYQLSYAFLTCPVLLGLRLQYPSSAEVGAGGQIRHRPVWDLAHTARRRPPLPHFGFREKQRLAHAAGPLARSYIRGPVAIPGAAPLYPRRRWVEGARQAPSKDSQGRPDHCVGRSGRDRTADPLGVNQVLSQLSYASMVKRPETTAVNDWASRFIPSLAARVACASTYSL